MTTVIAQLMQLMGILSHVEIRRRAKGLLKLIWNLLGRAWDWKRRSRCIQVDQLGHKVYQGRCRFSPHGQDGNIWLRAFFRGGGNPVGERN